MDSPLWTTLRGAFPTLNAAEIGDRSACWIRRALRDPAKSHGGVDSAFDAARAQEHSQAIAARLRQIHPVGQVHSATQDNNIVAFLAEVCGLAYTIRFIDEHATFSGEAGMPDIRAADGAWIEVKWKRETSAERDLWERYSVPVAAGVRMVDNAPLTFDGDPANPTNQYAIALTRLAEQARQQFQRARAVHRILYLQLDLDFVQTTFSADDIWERGLPEWAKRNAACYDRLVVSPFSRWEDAQQLWPEPSSATPPPPH